MEAKELKAERIETENIRRLSDGYEHIFAMLRARSKITSHVSEPIHPARLRCSSVK